MGTSDRRRRVILCDASPLIFLAKLDFLNLIRDVTGLEIVVFDCVMREVLVDRATPAERKRLQDWIMGVTVISHESSLFASNALSKCDRSSLAWAVENKAAWILADERLLRRLAREHGIQTIGFCGILIQAVRKGILKTQTARDALDCCIEKHGFRISLDLYRQILRELEGLP